MDSITWDVLRVTAIKPCAVGMRHLTATGQPRGLLIRHLTTTGWPRGVFSCHLTASGQPRGMFIMGHWRESIADGRGKREDSMRTRSGFT